jgi:tetratricopeptide (TPR) repeat protein
MIGTQLGWYHIRSELGAGAMGVVYLAEDDEGKRYALKVVHRHLLSSPDSFQRFLREVEVGRRVDHPNVVRTIDVGSAELNGEPVHYLVMEYVEGRNLREQLAELCSIPEALLREIAVQTASGLAAIHACGVIHRDLKPENVLITRDQRVRVMDLGVAKLQEASISITGEGRFAGSLTYAAPEQFEARGVGPAADLYSLGVMFYELATGQNPFQRDDTAGVIQAQLQYRPLPAHETAPDLSLFFSEVINTLLSKDPSGRFASAADLELVLRQGEESEWWAQREPLLRRRQELLPRIQVRRETRLHGRGEELDSMAAAWRQARAGKGGVLLVQGEAGLGKTRLIDAFVQELDEESMHLLYGSYAPSGGIGGLSDAILAKFGRANTAEAVATYLSAMPGFAPAFAALARHEVPPPGAPHLGAEALDAVLCQLFRALADERPTLWIVDDLHFAPPESRRMVLALARVAFRREALMLVTMRPELPDEELAEFARLEGFHKLVLNRLSPREVIELLQEAFRSTALAEELGGKIAYKSDGVPFFVFEMIRGLKEGQFVRQLPGGTFVQTRAIGEIEVPSAVRDLVEARLKELTREERSILEVGAVAGFEFDPDLVARVLDQRRVHVLQDLADMERRSGIVRVAGNTYRFDHHQIQEVLVSGLSEPLRREYHSLVGRALVERSRVAAADLSGEATLAVVSHHLDGSTPAEALPFLERALTHLDQRFMHEGYVRLADKVLGVKDLLPEFDRIDLALKRVERLENLGRRTEIDAGVTEALAAAKRLGDGGLEARSRLAVGVHLTRSARFEEAYDELMRALAIAERSKDPGLIARVTGILTVPLRHLGRFDEGRRHGERSLALAEQHGDVEGQARAAGNLGTLLITGGHYSLAEEYLERSLALARAAGDRGKEARAMGNLASLYVLQGRYEEHRATQRAHLSLSREIGHREGEAAATASLGVEAMRRGRYAEALDRCEEFLALSIEFGSRQWELIARMNLSSLFIHLGDRERATSMVEVAGKLAAEIGSPTGQGEVVALSGRIAEQAGDFEQAAKHYATHLEFCERFRPEGVQGHAQFMVARVEQARGHTEAAIERLERARELAEQGGHLPMRILTAAHLATHGLADPGEILELLRGHEERLEALDRMEAHFVLWRATGDTECLAAAKSILEDLKTGAPPEFQAALVREVPLHRAIAEA